MSEVKRYLADEQYPGQYSARCDLVPAKAYDALREELAEIRKAVPNSTREIVDLRKSLTAAEQRNAVLSEEITSLSTRLNERDKLIDHIGSMIAKACSSNQKPTESGASEVARLALKMENQRITPARFKCLACGEYHEGSGNLPCPKMKPMSGASE